MAQTAFEKNSGALIALLATGTTIVVVGYFFFVFWMGEKLGFVLTVDEKTIPEETYPILLLSAWNLLQRAKAHWRPRGGGVGKFWHAEDLLEAWLAVIFFAITAVYAFVTNTNLTFVVIMLAFFVQAVGDAFMNGRHRYERGAPAQASATAGGGEWTGDVQRVPIELDIQPRIRPAIYDEGEAR